MAVKSKTISWQIGQQLAAEHLNEFRSLIDIWGSILHSTSIYKWGILDLNIDGLKLIAGEFVINKITAILPDGTYINNNIENYDNSLDLKNQIDRFLTPQKLYLNISAEDSEVQSKIIANRMIDVFYKAPKWFIDFKGIIPICEVAIKGGNFVLTDFIPASYSISKESLIYKETERLFLFLQRMNASLHDRLAAAESVDTEEILFVSSIFKALGILTNCLLNYKHPFDFYKALVDICGTTGWKYFSNFPLIKTYDHYDPLNSIRTLTTIIYELTSGLKEDYISRDFEFVPERKQYQIFLDTVGTGNLLLIIEPANEASENWIMNAPIASSNFYDDICTQLVTGIKRQLIRSSAGFVIIELNKSDEYLKINENLIIGNGGIISIKRISLNIKK